MADTVGENLSDVGEAMSNQFADQAEAFAAGLAQGRAEALMQAAQINKQRERAGWALLEDIRKQLDQISDDLEIGLDPIFVWSPNRERTVF